MIVLCSSIAIIDINRADQLFFQIKREIKRICKGNGADKIDKWIEVMKVSPAGSRMELRAAEELANVMGEFKDFMRTKPYSMSKRARRVLARRALDLARRPLDIKDVGITVRSDTEIFGIVLEKLNVFPDSIEKYFSISSLGEEWEAEAYEKIRSLQPSGEEDRRILKIVERKIANRET